MNGLIVGKAAQICAHLHKKKAAFVDCVLCLEYSTAFESGLCVWWLGFGWSGQGGDNLEILLSLFGCLFVHCILYNNPNR